MDNRLRKLEEEQKKLMEEIDRNNKRISGKSDPKKEKNILMQFFIGLLLLGAGLFWIFQTVRVSTNWGYFYPSIGSFHIPNGTVIIPLLIGIVMLFLMEKKIFGWTYDGHIERKILFYINLAFQLRSDVRIYRCGSGNGSQGAF